MKKFLAILLAAAMVIGLAACTAEPKQEATEAAAAAAETVAINEPVTL